MGMAARINHEIHQTILSQAPVTVTVFRLILKKLPGRRILVDIDVQPATLQNYKPGTAGDCGYGDEYLASPEACGVGVAEKRWILR
jgi:hypothetical protein